ncbi:MAG: hypothetical protein ACR2L4_10730 [Actinomycetota bacterium]
MNTRTRSMALAIGLAVVVIVIVLVIDGDDRAPKTWVVQPGEELTLSRMRYTRTICTDVRARAE